MPKFEIEEVLNEAESMCGEIERKLDPDNFTFMIKQSEITEIYQLVRKMGGDGTARNKIQKILTEVVERTG